MIEETKSGDPILDNFPWSFLAMQKASTRITCTALRDRWMQYDAHSYTERVVLICTNAKRVHRIWVNFMHKSAIWHDIASSFRNMVPHSVYWIKFPIIPPNTVPTYLRIKSSEHFTFTEILSLQASYHRTSGNKKCLLCPISCSASSPKACRTCRRSLLACS